MRASARWCVKTVSRVSTPQYFFVIVSIFQFSVSSFEHNQFVGIWHCSKRCKIVPVNNNKNGLKKKTILFIAVFIITQFSSTVDNNSWQISMHKSLIYKQMNLTIILLTFCFLAWFIQSVDPLFGWIFEYTKATSFRLEYDKNWARMGLLNERNSKV